MTHDRCIVGLVTEEGHRNERNTVVGRFLKAVYAAMCDESLRLMTC